MSVVMFAVAVVSSAAAAQPLPYAGTALEIHEVDGVDLDDLLARAAASARRYVEAIQDLTTEETTTILTYDNAGRVTGRRVFVSQFMIHRFTHGDGGMEYRQVLSVDGREAGDRELRVQALATELANASSESEERELIDRESGKFGLAPRGLDASLTGSNLQNSFDDWESLDAAIAGRETIDGMDFILVDYRLIRPIRISFGLIGGLIARFADIPKVDRAQLRGRLWLEASSGDLWREEGGYFLEGLPGISEDQMVTEYEFQYARSSFGIFTPERFEVAPEVTIRPSTKGQGSFTTTERRILEFAPFERFGADVQLFLEEPVQ